jgi:hypothetical protein
LVIVVILIRIIWWVSTITAIIRIRQGTRQVLQVGLVDFFNVCDRGRGAISFPDSGC